MGFFTQGNQGFAQGGFNPIIQLLNQQQLGGILGGGLPPQQTPNPLVENAMRAQAANPGGFFGGIFGQQPPVANTPLSQPPQGAAQQPIVPAGFNQIAQLIQQRVKGAANPPMGQIAPTKPLPLQPAPPQTFPTTPLPPSQNIQPFFGGAPRNFA